MPSLIPAVSRSLAWLWPSLATCAISVLAAVPAACVPALDTGTQMFPADAVPVTRWRASRAGAPQARPRASSGPTRSFRLVGFSRPSSLPGVSQFTIGRQPVRAGERRWGRSGERASGQGSWMSCTGGAGKPRRSTEGWLDPTRLSHLRIATCPGLRRRSDLCGRIHALGLCQPEWFSLASALRRGASCCPGLLVCSFHAVPSLRPAWVVDVSAT